jgi:VWFA-related protein
MLPLVLALLFAQSPQTTTPTFLETLDVRVANVDVVVADRHGNAIRGLGRNDFVVLENGVPQAITNFAEYSGSKGSAETIATTAAGPAAEDVTAPPPRKFLFFVDDMSLTDRNQKQLIESATRLIHEQMRAGDEAMVMTRAQTSDVKLQFTPDRAAVEKTLRAALQTQSEFRTNTGHQSEEFFFQSVVLRSSSPKEYLQMARIYAARVNRRVTGSLRALLGLVGSLNQTSGRKVLVVLSESITSEPGHEAYGLMTLKEGLQPTVMQSLAFPSEGLESAKFDAAETGSRASWFDVRPMIRELAARAGANGVTIYTLQPDLGGAIVTPGGGAAVGRGRSSPMGQSAAAGTFAVDQFHRTTLEGTRDTLQTLADETGGKYFLGARELADGFRQIGEDLTSYYSLGYRSEAGEGVKKIEVRVKNRPELVVRARREMLQRTPEREMDEMVAANLLVPRAVNELGITASAGKPQNGIQNVRVPVIVRIPLSNLTFIPDGDKYRGAFSVHYAAADSAGFTAGLYRDQVLEIPAADIDAARARFFTYTTYLAVAPGTLKVAVGVLDKYSRLAGFQQLEIAAR